MVRKRVLDKIITFSANLISILPQQYKMADLCPCFDDSPVSDEEQKKSGRKTKGGSLDTFEKVENYFLRNKCVFANLKFEMNRA